MKRDGWNPYAVLGVPDLSDMHTVMSAWKRKAAENHPDRGGNSEEFIKVRRAMEELTDVEYKQKIDSMILCIPVRDWNSAMSRAVDSLFYNILERDDGRL